MIPPQAIGMAAGLLSSIPSLITAGKQKRMAKDAAATADRMNAQTLNWANKGLSTAQGLNSMALNNYNGRSAGIAQAQNNINSSGANALANMGRSARSSADLLSMGGAVQAQTNNAFSNLAAQEAAERANRFTDLQQTTAGVQNAQGNIQNYYGAQAQQAQQSANQLMQAGMMNQQNAINDLASTGVAFGMGAFGDPSTMFQKKIPQSIIDVRSGSFNPLLPSGGRSYGMGGGLMPNGQMFGNINLGLKPPINFGLPTG